MANSTAASEGDSIPPSSTEALSILLPPQPTIKFEQTTKIEQTTTSLFVSTTTSLPTTTHSIPTPTPHRPLSVLHEKEQDDNEDPPSKVHIIKPPPNAPPENPVPFDDNILESKVIPLPKSENGSEGITAVIDQTTTVAPPSGIGNSIIFSLIGVACAVFCVVGALVYRKKKSQRTRMKRKDLFPIVVTSASPKFSLPKLANVVDANGFASFSQPPPPAETIPHLYNQDSNKNGGSQQFLYSLPTASPLPPLKFGDDVEIGNVYTSFVMKGLEDEYNRHSNFTVESDQVNRDSVTSFGLGPNKNGRITSSIYSDFSQSSEFTD